MEKATTVTRQAPDRRTRVFHVDDNPEATTLLSLILRSEPDLEEVGCANEVEGLVDQLQRCKPDVLLIDLLLHGDNSIATIREVHARFPALRIVVLSGYSDPKLLDAAKAAGASECAQKCGELRETLAVLRGRTVDGSRGR